jgi:hypothetical protein
MHLTVICFGLPPRLIFIPDALQHSTFHNAKSVPGVFEESGQTVSKGSADVHCNNRIMHALILQAICSLLVNTNPVLPDRLIPVLVEFW